MLAINIKKREVARQVFLTLACSATASLLAAAEPTTVNYNLEVRTLLSNNCFQCHGPDENQRKANLRLDRLAATSAKGDSGRLAIAPGEPEKSELIRRITHPDPDDRMPPPESGKRLTEQEIQLLTNWVRGGAKLGKHWSYEKPVRPATPQVRDTSWPTNEIDYFVLAPLEQADLAPSRETDRYALIRRLSLDLTGLPPTWEEVEEFVKDADSGAVERLVDRLMEKPSFGEHWARKWLDLARYADSAGYADDPSRTIWAYRDWVIRAINANQLFDQFTIEQLAGDLLPAPTSDQLVATAFHRNTLTNSEGGTDDEEFRNVAVVDRVNTTMAIWMGTTMGCAQCHNHKFDPISQEEYFRVFAIFNNTEDTDQHDESPLLTLWSKEQQQQKVAWQHEMDQLESQITPLKPTVLKRQAQWESRWKTDFSWTPIVPARVTSRSGTEMTLLDDGSILAARKEKTDVYTLEFVFSKDTSFTALQLEAIPDASLPDQGPGHAKGNFVISGVRVHTETQLPLAAAFADFFEKDYDANNIIHHADDPDRGWAIAPEFGQRHTLSITLASPLSVTAGEKLSLSIDQLSERDYHVLGRFRIRMTDDPQIADYANTPSSTRQILKIKGSERSPEQQTELAYYFLSVSPETAKPARQLISLKKQLAEMKPTTTVPIMRELTGDKLRLTHIQRRGNFLDLDQQVTVGLPEAFHAPPKNEPLNRLALARWLIDENNPLTARVIANRYWDLIFGVGLVQTSEEFGSQGELPSHPQLLDWLATELVRLRWDMKAFLKLVVSSATYRQSSAVTPAQFEMDPDNRLLARGPRFRISAETVRDQALFVSGLLSDKMYGPPVHPPQPALGLRAAFGSTVDWDPSEGEDRYRRALYTTWRRSNPYPSMATFDAPNREVCTVRRARTNTPLQALVTLNDPVYVEAAQALGRRMAMRDGSIERGATYGFRLCLARNPEDEELQQLVELFDQSHQQLSKDPEKARQLATIPLGPVPEGADTVELASWTVVGNILLNLDEMFLKR